MELVEFDGVWWRAGTIGEQVSGTLTFAPGGPPALKLVGSFKPLEQAFAADASEPIIQGFSTTGKAITLAGCAEASTNISFPGMMSTTYSAKFEFVGAHFEALDDITFPVIDLSLTNLADWTLRHGFTLRIEAKDQPRSFGLDYTLPDVVQGRVGDLEVQLRHSFQPRQHNLEQWTFTQTSYLRLASPQPLPFEQFLNGPTVHLMNLVAFGTGVPVYPALFRAHLVNPPEADGIAVYFNTGETAQQPVKLLPVNMLFGLGDLLDDFDGVLTNWFKCRETLEPVLDLYVATLYGTAMRLNNQFLNLAQALESYHRRTHGGSLLPKADFRNLLKAFRNRLRTIRRAVPPWLSNKAERGIKDRFSHMNEITLSDRLNGLLDEAPPTVVAAAIPDRIQFEKVVRYTRNWLTHHDEKSRKFAAEGIDLLNLTERMRWLLEALLLKRLGLPDAKIEELLRRNERLKRVGMWTLA